MASSQPDCHAFANCPCCDVGCCGWCRFDNLRFTYTESQGLQVGPHQAYKLALQLFWAIKIRLSTSWQASSAVFHFHPTVGVQTAVTARHVCTPSVKRHPLLQHRATTTPSSVHAARELPDPVGLRALSTRTVTPLDALADELSLYIQHQLGCTWCCV